jgi:hypothetical protein
LFSPSLVALHIVLKNARKKYLKKISSSTATAQNWTPRKREVCDFLDTSSGLAHSTPKQVKVLYQPTINLTWNQLRINLDLCV